MHSTAPTFSVPSVVPTTTRGHKTESGPVSSGSPSSAYRASFFLSSPFVAGSRYSMVPLLALSPMKEMGAM